ncbi:MAG: RDD family protein [Acidimicrobiales bacterium]
MYGPPPPPGAWQQGGWAPVTRGPSGPRAGFWARLGAWIIDVIAVGVVNRIVAVALGPALGAVVAILISFVYFGFFEGGPAGQTLGKKALGIRVVRISDGGPLGWGPALLRHLYSYVSGLACLVGYFWMLGDAEKQTWHDKWTSTVEVPAAAFPPPPDSFAKPPAG